MLFTCCIFMIRLLGLVGFRDPHRSIILRWLFLATIASSCCLATSSFPDSPIYGELSNLDSGGIIDSLSLGIQKSHLVVRQSNESNPLSDNAVIGMDLAPGTTDFWTFSPSQLNVTNEGGSITLYITVNTCTQPFPKAGLNATQIYQQSVLPPLSLYVSTDPSNKLPGPSADSSRQNVTQLNAGFANMTLSDVSSDVYISVSAQNTSSDWQGSWSYQLGTSTTGQTRLCLSS